MYSLILKENLMKNILITGVSSGFGRALAEQALLAGHRVIGTVRKQDDLETFKAIDPERATGNE
jgi:NAD(P)-dependent dehydrogenase (short-subunit alcohol dehydrogenase family)